MGSTTETDSPTDTASGTNTATDVTGGEGSGLTPAKPSGATVAAAVESITALPPIAADRHSSAGDVVLRYAGEQVLAMAHFDPLLRTGDGEHIHQGRVAVRRLRSVLATYRRLLRADLVGHLREELKWFAGELGAVRDVQVIHDRLHAALADEAPRLVVGPVAADINDELGRQGDAAGLRVAAALDSPRYAALLSDLLGLLTDPPLSDAASKPATRILPELIRKDWKRLHSDVRRANTLPEESAERETALHDARKSGKRLRYGAEAAAPLDSKKLKRLVKTTQDLQTSLGAIQDSIVAQETLLVLQQVAHSAGHSTFTYGRLHAREQAITSTSTAEFFADWADFPTPTAKI